MADAVGKIGVLNALVAVDSGAKPNAFIAHDSGYVRVVGKRLNFGEADPSYIATAGYFVGLKGSMEARLISVPEINAAFIGPTSRLDAVMRIGETLVGALVGPKGYIEGQLEVEEPLSIEEASFVGPLGQFSSSIEFFSAEAGFRGLSGRMQAAMLGDAGSVASFIGPTGAFEAELKNTLEVQSSFVGPFGMFDVQLGEDYRMLSGEFIGLLGSFETELKNPLGAAIGFVGPKGIFQSELYAPLAINADFVGPVGKLDAFVSDQAARIDAFFRGPRSHMDANLELNYPNIEASIEYSYNKYSMEIQAEADSNSTLTFLLIQP